MSTSVVASYSIPALVKGFIDRKSQEMKLSKGKFFAYMIEDWQHGKEEIKLLKAYLEMAGDIDFLREQISESEADLRAETIVNPTLM